MIIAATGWKIAIISLLTMEMKLIYCDCGVFLFREKTEHAHHIIVKSRKEIRCINLPHLNIFQATFNTIYKLESAIGQAIKSDNPMEIVVNNESKETYLIELRIKTKYKMVVDSVGLLKGIWSKELYYYKDNTIMYSDDSQAKAKIANLTDGSEVDMNININKAFYMGDFTMCWNERSIYLIDNYVNLIKTELVIDSKDLIRDRA